MTRKLTAMLLALSCAATLSEASAQTQAATPASGEVVADAAAVQCTRIVPTPDDVYIYNDCGYRIAIATCVPRNARAAFLCKTDGSADISTKLFYISPRGNVTTGFPNGASVYLMACKATAKPILASATGGTCVQP